MMDKCIIYALTDPDTGIIRYIGKTIRRPRDRYKMHLIPSQLRVKTHKNNWVKFLLKQGKKPGMEILTVVDAENANTTEIAYITAKALGIHYGVSKSAMQHIITRRTWRHV